MRKNTANVAGVRNVEMAGARQSVAPIRKSFTSVDNCNQLFTAFSEFRRLTIRFKNGENRPDEKVPDLSKILKEHGISRNYVGFVKKELVERKLVNAKFTKWNDLMSKPTYEMAESVASSASKALSAYQKEMEKKRKAAKKAEQEAAEKSQKPDLLEGVEISPNPQRMEDDVLDGYDRVTGEWDYLPESAVEPVKEERNPLYEILDKIDPFVIMSYLKERASNKGLEIAIKLK